MRMLRRHTGDGLVYGSSTMLSGQRCDGIQRVRNKVGIPKLKVVNIFYKVDSITTLNNS